MKLGVFTVSVPDWEPIEAMEKLAAIGYDGVEWRVTEDAGDRSKPSFWSGNRTSMTAEEVIERADELKAKARELALEMPSLGTYIDCGGLEQIETSMRAAAAVGAKALRVGPGRYKGAQDPYPELASRARDQYAQVAELAARHGVRAVIETHMGQLGPSVTKAMGILGELDPRHVGIMWDPGNQLVEGAEVPRMALEIAGDYLAEVHVKNMTFEVKEQSDEQVLWRPANTPVHKGLVDWPAVIDALKDAGYDGWLIFEDFSTEMPLQQRLEHNHRWFRQLIG